MRENRTKSNEAAFAGEHIHYDSEGREIYRTMNKGLTKREYFAAAALKGLCSNELYNTTHLAKAMAKEGVSLESLAVEFADGIIKALNKDSGGSK